MPISGGFSSSTTAPFCLEVKERLVREVWMSSGDIHRRQRPTSTDVV
jgi:hypothetical protein